MIRLKDFNFIALFFLLSVSLHAQFSFKGRVTSATTGKNIPEAEVFHVLTGAVEKTNANGEFSFDNLKEGTYTFVIFAESFEVYETQLSLSEDVEKTFVLTKLSEELSEVVITQRRERIFALRNLKPVEGTAIYAGKKTEVVLLDKVTGNLAANNARQIYSQVVGLNIYDNGDAGLQLNIGGRGLDPNRTQNFNTRQNGYDISADVLGYPESYYTPPPEALEEIQVIRGAASLQYGTQFGGLINFKFKKPNKYKKIELVSRQSLGSNQLFTSFNSLSGTVGKLSYYTYYHYKGGNGFRDNSGFDSHQAFAHLGYQISEQTKLEFEYTFLDYLAQQPGGITDAQFYENPDYSNRERNWFKVNWNLFSAKLKHQFSKKTDFSLNLFGLSASRKALGFRNNRVSSVDDPSLPRELLVDHFENWGAEARFLTRYQLLDQESVFLIGSKFYKAHNTQMQGAGNAGSEANFNFATREFPNYERQADFTFPNQNLAFFGENIFRLNSRLSVTPGFRLEFIDTESKGSYQNIVSDNAGNVLVNETLEDNRNLERSFVLLGIGANYQLSSQVELLANFSQNYRSVTFNDIRVINPVFVIDPNINDEEGFTADIGMRGKLSRKLRYELGVFGLQYKDRIGEILQNQGRIVRYKSNIGDAFIYGIETFAEFDLKNQFFNSNKNLQWSIFNNFTFTQSEYTQSQQTNVEGNKVEFIPEYNLKTGMRFGYKNLMGSLQYSYLSKQFTDATNAPQVKTDSQRGIEGEIPAYGILDFSLSYVYKRFRLETGINNLLNNDYFTRRATGYPGPGIIPAQPINWYTTLQVKI